MRSARQTRRSVHGTSVPPRKAAVPSPPSLARRPLQTSREPAGHARTPRDPFPSDRRRDTSVGANSQARRSGRRLVVAVVAIVAGLVLAVPARAAATPTVVSLTFDDGTATEYQVRSLLSSHGMLGT